MFYYQSFIYIVIFAGNLTLLLFYMQQVHMRKMISTNAIVKNTKSKCTNALYKLASNLCTS